MMTDEVATAIIAGTSLAYSAVEGNQQRQKARGEANAAERFRRRQEAEAERALATQRAQTAQAAQTAAMRARRSAAGASGYAGTGIAKLGAPAAGAAPKTALGL